MRYLRIRYAGHPEEQPPPMFDFSLLEQQTKELGVLSKAPVQEAVIACNYAAETVDQQIALYEAAKLAFPDFTWEPQNKLAVNVQVRAEEGKPLAMADTIQGARYLGRQPGNNLTLILDNSQLAVSILAPYSHWDDFSQRAIDYGQRLAAQSGIEVARYGLRYVNQILLNLPLAEYLRDSVCPKYPVEQVPLVRQQHRSEFFIPDSFYFASLTWFFEPVQFQPRVTGNLMMDIDVGVLDPERGKEFLSDQLGHMRLFKNYLFYQTVSEKVLELCR